MCGLTDSGVFHRACKTLDDSRTIKSYETPLGPLAHVACLEATLDELIEEIKNPGTDRPASGAGRSPEPSVEGRWR